MNNWDLGDQTTITASDIAKAVALKSMHGIEYLSLLLKNREKSNDLTKKVSMLLPRNNKRKTDARGTQKNDK